MTIGTKTIIGIIAVMVLPWGGNQVMAQSIKTYWEFLERWGKAVCHCESEGFEKDDGQVIGKDWIRPIKIEVFFDSKKALRVEFILEPIEGNWVPTYLDDRSRYETFVEVVIEPSENKRRFNVLIRREPNRVALILNRRDSRKFHHMMLENNSIMIVPRYERKLPPNHFNSHPSSGSNRIRRRYYTLHYTSRCDTRESGEILDTLMAYGNSIIRERYDGSIRYTVQDFNDALESQQPMVVMFGADWYPPCKVAKPILERYAKRNKNVITVYLDVGERGVPTEERIISRKYHVSSIPSIIVFRNGRLVEFFAGWREEKIRESYRTAKR